MTVPVATMVIVAALALAWIALAAAIAIVAARRFRLAETILGAARSNASLLEATPARPLLIRPDRRVDVDSQLLRDLGLKSAPAHLSGLTGNDSGLDARDLELLSAAIEGARVSAQRIVMTVRANGSARVFEVRGGPAPSPEPPGTLLLWFYDTSTGEEDRARLALKLRQTESALDSLAHLIEAAPFPMWYRGPDLKLGLVNRAFVEAVEGRDAADVIERGAELVDAEGDDSPIETARRAVETERVQSAMQPAILRGERRMLRIVNVPLATGAVAGFAVDVQDLEDARTELARHIESQ
ncbi:MAG: histidine kinase, partial [Sphingomicrobium sp.]